MSHYAAYALIGLAAGLASALLGIGGGVIMVPALIVLMAVPIKSATVTSLVYIVSVALAGALLGLHRGYHVSWVILAVAVPAGLVGAHLGTVVKVHISSVHLKVIFGLLMLLIGARLVAAPWLSPKTPPPPKAPEAEAPIDMP